MRATAAWERRVAIAAPRIDGRVVLVAVLAVVLAWQVLVPVGFLVLSSFKPVAPGRPTYWDLTFSVDNYVRAFASGDLVSSSLNSLAFTLPSAAFAFTIGTAIAWLTQRTNVVFKTALYVLAFAQSVIPSALSAVAWIFLLSPRVGLLDQWVHRIGLSDETFDVFTLPGMIWVQGLDMVPLAFLLMAAVLRSMDPGLEEQAAASGAGTLRTLRRVTLPLMRPGALAVLILLVVHGLETFEVPALIGLRAGHLVYATEIYLATRSLPRLDFGLAGAFAMTLLVLSAVAVLAYYRLLGTSSRFATITGKAYRPRLIDLGRWRYALAGAALAVLGIVSFVPMLTIAWASLVPFLQLPSAESFAQVGLANYARVLADPLVPRAFVNSFVLGAAAATIVTLLTSLIAFVTVRTRIRGRVFLDAIAFAPIALPGVVIALAVLWTYLVLRVPIYGTLWIILAAYITKYLPVAMRLSSASMAQVHADLEDAAAMSGAGWVRVLRRILWPLVLPGAIASWAWVMVHAFREVSVGTMLYVQGTETLGVAVFSLTNDGGNYPKVAALGVMIFGLLVLFAVGARIAAGRRTLIPR